VAESVKPGTAAREAPVRFQAVGTTNSVEKVALLCKHLGTWEGNSGPGKASEKTLFLQICVKYRWYIGTLTGLKIAKIVETK
jgi:hypothetical protein